MEPLQRGPVPAGQLAPLEVESTPSLVAARIRAGIYAREFLPDSQLNEVELARAFQVSRGPIREAFTLLSHEGLLRRERNRGVFVVALDDDSVRDVFYAREVIERAAALRAAARQDADALAQLQAVLHQIELALDGDWSELVALDLEFHRCLVRAAGSDRLERAFDPLYAETRMCLSSLEPFYVDRTSLLDEHRALLAAVRAPDSSGVIENLVHTHMTDTAAKLTTSKEGR